MSAVNLDWFSKQLPRAPDPFDLCLQTLSPDIFVVEEVPGVNRKSGGPNALPVKQQVRSWRTFTYPRPRSASGRALLLFSEWFLTLSEAKRNSVFSKHIKQPIKSACRTSPDNTESICSLISLLHLQPYVSPNLCFIPVLVAGSRNHQNLISEYLNGCGGPQVELVKSELQKLISNKNKIGSLSQLYQVQVTESLVRIEQCLERCSNPMLEPITVPRTDLQNKRLSSDPTIQLKAEEVAKLIELWRENRSKLVKHLSEQHFPNSVDPFNLCLVLINSLSGSTHIWTTFHFPKTKSLSNAILEAFSQWFHSLNSTKRSQVFHNFVRQPIIDACKAGNFSCICHLVAFLQLQHCFEPELFLIPTHMQSTSGSDIVNHYLKGCHANHCEEFVAQLDALLASSQNELATFSQKCHASVTMTHERLANDVASYKEKYSLKETTVPNLITRANVSPMVTEKCFEKEGGGARLNESLSSDHFSTAIDPFKLCLELLSLPNWGKFQFAKKPKTKKESTETVIQTFILWFGSLDGDKKKHVFDEFMKKPISDACHHNGNVGTMCKLLTRLHLFEEFESEEDLFLIPTQLQGRFQFVEEYLNHCSQASRQRFASKLDALLAVSEIELEHLAQKCSASFVTTHAIIEKSVYL